MARIIPRKTRSGGSNSDARRSATAPPPPPPKKAVFVIDDDSDGDDDDDTEEEGGGGGDVEVQQHRVDVRNQWPSELQKDRQSNGDSNSESSSGSRSESSIRFVSDQEAGSDSIEVSEEERGGECGPKSSPELDSSDDEEGGTSNRCSSIEKSKSLEIPEEEEVDENEVKPMAKLLPFCVARRTRAQIGKINRVSYSEHFKEEFSDDSEDEEGTEGEESEKGESYDYAEKSESVSVLGGSSEDNEVFMKKTKMKKMGTARNPVCLDVDELQSEEDEVEDDGIGMDLDRGKGKWVCNRNKGGSGINTRVGNGVRDGNRTKMQDADISQDLVERKRKWVDSDTEDAGRMGTRVSNMMESKRTSKKRKRVRPPNANELFKILASNSFNEDDSVARQKNFLPLLFSFGDDDAKPVERAEHEKEIDDSWADFDFATEANNIGVYHDDEV